MTDAELAGLARRGFDPVLDEGGFRLRYQVPQELRGHLDAELLCRGKLLDGTGGVPSKIAERLLEQTNPNPLRSGSRGRRPLAGVGSAHGLHLVAPWQVHGTAVAEGRPIWALPQRPRADGVLLDAAFDPSGSVRGSLRFGDCAPILVASSYPRPWALMLHSGFRGTLLGILPAAWRVIRSRYGEPDPGRTYAWIGPAIGPCCYTRRSADPLARQAAERWGRFASPEAGLVRLDLPGVIQAQARDAGLPDENIYLMDLCTCCRSDLFYSYRAGDTDDRMVLTARLT